MVCTTDRHQPLPPICILAGGLGTRLGALAASRPKAILEVAGRPFVLHQLELLAAHGAERVVLCVGHLGEQIEGCVGPSRFGLEIAYSYDGPELDGTLGAIRRAAPLLGERFLYLYGDTYLRLDYRAADDAWRASGKPALMTVLENAGRWGASNAVFDDGLVTSYDKAVPQAEMRWIDYGLGGLTPAALAATTADERDLAGLHRRLAASGELCGFLATERFYEIGSPEALAETDRFLRTGGGPYRTGSEPGGGPVGGLGSGPDRTSSGPHRERPPQPGVEVAGR